MVNAMSQATSQNFTTRAALTTGAFLAEAMLV
jgi:hypothetical protein